MTLAVDFHDISKQYRVGEIGTGTISRDLERAWAKLRGKPDPYAVIGEVNDRTTTGGSEFVWALKNVSFGIEQGEVFGIIGHNGAGKSTLLKVLSRITAPTTGRIRTYGRIASLLEVGTGFHPELTGRDNVYLNGALLGMTRREIRQRMDEIVAFSGCAKYIDTPVKRYSSGMTVRLGFSVAAHLDCQILVVDEVLAVGDAQFQKQCLDRMSELAHDGRTILFVSHNMQAVQQLCTKACVIEKGQVGMLGDVETAVTRYLTNFCDESFDQHAYAGNNKMRRGFGTARFSKIRFQDGSGGPRDQVSLGDRAHLAFSIHQFEPSDDPYRVHLKLFSGITGEEVTSVDHYLNAEQRRAALEGEVVMQLDTSMLRPGIYPVYLWLGHADNPSICYDVVDGATQPLLITESGSTAGAGLFNVQSQLAYARGA